VLGDFHPVLSYRAAFAPGACLLEKGQSKSTSMIEMGGPS
jgi:hypothetical protein